MHVLLEPGKVSPAVHYPEPSFCEALGRDLCRGLSNLAKAYGVDEAQLARDLLASSLAAPHLAAGLGLAELGYGVIREAVRLAPSLVLAFEQLFFRGFKRLITTMEFEGYGGYPGDYFIDEPVGDEEGRSGFSLDFASSSGGIRRRVSLGLGYDRRDPAHLEVIVESRLLVEGGGRGCNVERVARRVIAGAKRTRAYRRLIDYLKEGVEAYDYWVELSPVSEEALGDDEAGGVGLSVYASGIPGFLLPFDLGLALDLTSHMADRLRRSIEKGCV